MENIDFSFMQTGFNNIKGVDQLSREEKATLLSTVSVYFEEAMKIAVGYVKYELRNEVTAADIILAMKAQALDHSDIWEKPETSERLNEGYQEIYQELATPARLDVDDLSDDDDDEEDDVEDGVEDDYYKMMEDVYKLVKTAESRWVDWNPDNKLEKILKTSITNTERKLTELTQSGTDYD